MVEDSIDGGGGWSTCKPGGRLLWIVPSLVLHVAVIGVWVAMPADEARRPREKLHVESAQLEQLQEHIEDAKLRELHREVRRLQEIKRSMANIRSKELISLKEFEEDMRSRLNRDGRQALDELLRAQVGLSDAQQQFMEGLLKIEGLVQKVQALLDQHAFGEAIPLARQVLDQHDDLQTKLKALDQQLLLVQAKFDPADAVFGWITGNEIARRWDDLVIMNEQVFTKQSTTSDKMDRVRLRQGAALKRLVGEHGIAMQLQRSLDEEKKAQAEFESQFALLTDSLRKADTDIKVCELKLRKADQDLRSVRRERGQLGRELQSIHGGHPDTQQRRTDVQKMIEATDQKLIRLSQQRKGAGVALQEAKNLAHQSGQRLKQLRAPGDRWQQQRKNLTDRLAQVLKALVGEADIIAAQQDVFDLQSQAMELSHSLIEAANRSEEVSQ
ncbi:hypothetical protein ACFQY0_10275 [Haloferula chungangensis]|uniref:Chromosome partition protein Smc n=1 Tax=Haloferula chungangensis TaxID=1048331 RepID=A0ABW2L5C3_9BACT